MDASFFPPLEYEAISDVISSLEPDLKDILGQLESRDPNDVIVEVLEQSDLGQMRNARMSAFRAAMDKVDLCLSQVAILRESENEAHIETDLKVIKRAEELYRSLMPQDMRSRRCVKNMTKDFMELLYFIAGQRAKFPTEIIKTFPDPSEPGDITDNAIHFSFEVKQVTDEESDDEGESSTEDESDSSDEEGPLLKIPAPSLEGGDIDLSKISDSYVGGGGLIRTHDGERQEEIVQEIRSFMCQDGVNEGTKTNVGNVLVAMETPVSTMEPVTQAMKIGELASDHVSHGTPTNSPRRAASTPKRHNGSNPKTIDWPFTPAPEPVEKTPNPATHANQLARVPTRVPPENCSWTPNPNLPEPAPPSPYVQGVRIVSQSKPDTIIEVSNTVRSRKPILVDRETFVTEASIEVEMADRSNRSSWEGRSRKRDNSRDRCRCKDYDERIESLERYRKQATEAEEYNVEKMRKLRIQNEELSDELRDVKRRLNDQSNLRPILVAPVDHAEAIPRPVTAHLAARPEIPHSSMSRQFPNPVERYEPLRPRSASFNGRKSDSYSVNTGQRENSYPKKADRRQEPNHKIPESKKPKDKTPALVRDPAPQREPDRRPGRGRGRRAGARQNSTSKDTPLREWLSNAKQPDTHVATTPPTPMNLSVEVTETRSPSWADEDPDDPDDQFSDHTSDTQTTSPPANECDSPPISSMGRAAIAECIDVYALPPSGQVSVNEHSTRPAEPNKGNSSAFGGARPKTTGKSGGNNTGNNAPKPKPAVPSGSNDGKKQKGKQDSGKPMSYAKAAATNNDWKTPRTKKRKYERLSPKNSRPLKGIAATVNREVYLQGLSLDGCTDEEEIVVSVRNYCIDRGIKPVLHSYNPRQV